MAKNEIIVIIPYLKNVYNIPSEVAPISHGTPKRIHLTFQKKFCFEISSKAFAIIVVLPLPVLSDNVVKIYLLYAYSINSLLNNVIYNIEIIIIRITDNKNICLPLFVFNFLYKLYITYGISIINLYWRWII